MFKNYFYLKRSVYELNKELKGTKILDIYSQEKNILYIKVPSKELPDRHLLISTNPQFPYMLIKKVHCKAKKNVVQIFTNHIPITINNIKIAKDDRIVRLDLSRGNIYFSIRGSKTNIHFINNNFKEEAFKKYGQLFSKEVNSLTFRNDLQFKQLENDNNEYDEIGKLKKYYPMISSELKNEILIKKNNSDSDNFSKYFKTIVLEILNGNIRVGFNSDLQKVIFVPNSFQTLVTDSKTKLFDNFNSALQFFIISFYKQSSKTNLMKELDKYFDKELLSLANKLNKLRLRIEHGSKEKLYFSHGNILLANIYQLTKGMKIITLSSYEDGVSVTIKLDPKLIPQHNINKYFEKARDEKINFNKSLELFKLTEQKYLLIKNEFDYYQKIDSVDEIEDIFNRVIPKKEKVIKMDSGLKFKYWHYLIDDLYHVYIGRDSKSNDYLSIKFAKQNDYWFHARGLPGSHVIIRVDNAKVGIPKDIIKKGATLAAFYSKAKTAGTAPVSYTLAKFVYKKKGMLPGQVLLKKESTLLVKPGIPRNCELVNE